MSEKSNRYKKKNKMFGAWLTIENHEWFSGFLQRHAHGNSLSERFQNYVKDLKLKERTGETAAAVNLRETMQPTRSNVWIYVRQLSKKVTPEKQEIRCQTCQSHFPTQFKACQELRSERS